MSSLPSIDSNLTEPSTDNSNLEAGIKSTVINNPLESSQNLKLSVSSDEYNLHAHQGTLNESIAETLARDFWRIFIKMKFVLNPYLKDNQKIKLLYDWDLWGPLMFNILLSLTLAFNNKDKGGMLVLVFLMFWFGSLLVYLNSNLIGSKITFFQVCSLLGYCLFPLNISAFIFVLSPFYKVIKLISILLCFSWCSYSCISFMKNMITEDKKMMLLYPIILFYLFFSWFILMNQ